MTDEPDSEKPGPGDEKTDGGPSAIVMLAVAVVVVVGGYFLSLKLKEMGRMQDCVMSGRTNCAPVTTPGR
jgi:hypothetical protein